MSASRKRSPPVPGTRGRAGGVTVVVPGQLRGLAGGRTALQLQGRPATIGDVLAGLRVEHPAVHARLATEQGELRPHINLFLDGEDIRRTGGLATPVAPGAEILILPSVSGG